MVGGGTTVLVERDCGGGGKGGAKLHVSCEPCMHERQTGDHTCVVSCLPLMHTWFTALLLAEARPSNRDRGSSKHNLPVDYRHYITRIIDTIPHPFIVP